MNDQVDERAHQEPRLCGEDADGERRDEAESEPQATRGGRKERYAAIAYSKSAKRYGYSQGCVSVNKAKNKAIQDCAAEDAKVTYLDPPNGWCSLAHAGDGAVGWGVGRTAAEADEKALLEMRETIQDARHLQNREAAQFRWKLSGGKQE